MRKRLIGWVSLGVVLGLLAVPVLAQEQKQAGAEEMAAMMAAMTPGPHHQAMMKSVGKWTTTSKTWMQPGAPPTESTGTATVEGLLDGRFIMETSKSTLMGMPFEGRGIFGYDNTTKKHIGTWFDSFGTMMMHLEGTCDGACKVLTMTSEYMDPATKTMKKFKMVSKEVSPDETTNVMYDVAKDGTENKMMEMTYKRQK